jgi:hypothetical protein
MIDDRFARGAGKKRKRIKYYDNDSKEIPFPLWVDKDAPSGSESD